MLGGITLVIAIPIAILASWGVPIPFTDATVVSIFLFLIAISILVFVVSLISDRKKEKQEATERSILTHRYESEKAEYDWQISVDRNRVAAENVIKAELESELKQLSDQNQSSKKALSAIYDVGVIYPKYRNFIMQCSILEYLSSGICTTLEGADGAYKTLEVEMRLDKIVMKLDQVISRLDSIKENQYMLYSAMKEGNQTASQILTGINQIASSLDDINLASANAQSAIKEKLDTITANSTIAAYNSQRIQQEIYYMNRVNYYSGRNDDAGVYHRVPPTP